MTSRVTLLVNGERCDVDVVELQRGRAQFRFRERMYEVSFEKSVPQEGKEGKLTGTKPHKGRKGSGTATEIVAPIPGVVSEILVSAGQKISAGDTVLRLEAMKMQNNIFAHRDATIEKILVEVGEEVSDGQPLIMLDGTK